MSVAKQWLGGRADFEAFIAAYDNPAFFAQVVAESGMERAEVEGLLRTYLDEMRFGFDFLSRHMPDRELRILEVGAGLCLLSIYLAKRGHTVTALEPAAHAFGIFETTKRLIWKEVTTDTIQLIEVGAEALNPQEHGTFQFIYSLNVMEHIDELDAATAAIATVMAPGAVCVNTCANYLIPYEPHYGLLLVPFLPELSRKVQAKSIDQRPEVWETLNFISSPWVKRMAKQNDLGITLEPGVLHDSLLRIGEDPSFAARHQESVVGKVYRMLKKTGLLSLTRYIPAHFATPMEFTYRKPN